MPPAISAVKKRLRIREIYEIKLLEYHQEQRLAVFWCSVQSGSYIRTLCEHLGLLLGVEGSMEELRRVRSGIMDEYKDLYTMHDILDAQYLYETKGDESYLRKITKPIEYLLVDLPRVIVKDTAVNAICYGGKLLLPGVLRFSPGMDIN